MQAYQLPPLPFLSGWQVIAHLMIVAHFFFVDFPLLVVVTCKVLNMPSLSVVFQTATRSQAFLGWLMLGSSLAAKFVGLPQQIMTNFKERTSPDGYKWFIILGFVSYLTQSIQAANDHDNWMVVAQAPGAIFTAALVLQMRLYKRAHPDALSRTPPISGPDTVSAIVGPDRPERAILTYILGEVEVGIPADLFLRGPDGQSPITRVFRENTAAGDPALVIDYGTVPTGGEWFELDHDVWVARAIDGDPNPRL